MCDHWMPTIRLALSPEEYRQLPRHSAYRYEYLNGEAILSPNTKHYHALLTLQPIELATNIITRPMQPGDLPVLEDVFASAFYRTQPYAGLDDETGMEAARAALERTRTGGDGPWIDQASVVAVTDGRPYGAVFITLLPLGDPTTWEAYYWDSAPPSDAVEQRLGRPHLTWIFVSPMWAGQGVGTALLAVAVKQLLAMGFTELLSTFMIGNDSSMLWHWRNGFQLLAHPTSFRKGRRMR
jgi:GNAT superfamily N-acetyltransferase